MASGDSSYSFDAFIAEREDVFRVLQTYFDALFGLLNMIDCFTIGGMLFEERRL